MAEDALEMQQNSFTDDIKDYELLAEIGVGGTAIVYRARHNIGGPCAIKKILNKHLEANYDSIKKEVALMNATRHDNLVGYLKTFVSKNGSLYIVMPLMSGSLQDLVRYRRNKLKHAESKVVSPVQVMKDKEIKTIIKYILKALQFMHSKKLIHRDVKATNIFISQQGVVKLGDYGVTKILKGASTYTGRHASFADDTGADFTLTGTPVFMAPDMQNDQYDEKVDIWSTGIVLHIMAFGKTPFRDLAQRDQAPLKIFIKVAKLRSGEELFKKPFHGEGPLPEINHDLKKLILQCTEVDPEKRNGAEKLLGCKYLRGAGDEAYLAREVFTRTVSDDITMLAENTAKTVIRKNPEMVAPGVEVNREQSSTITQQIGSESTAGGDTLQEEKKAGGISKDKQEKLAGLILGQSNRFTVKPNIQFDLDTDSESDEPEVFNDPGTPSRFQIKRQTKVALRMRTIDDSMVNIAFDMDEGDSAENIISEMVNEQLIPQQDRQAYEEGLDHFLRSMRTQVFKVTEPTGTRTDRDKCRGYSKFTNSKEDER